MSEPAAVYTKPDPVGALRCRCYEQLPAVVEAVHSGGPLPLVDIVVPLVVDR